MPQPNQPEYYPEPSPENGGYKMLNVIMSANIRGAGEYENIAFENEENLKAFLYSNLAYKADAAKDLEGLLKIIPELKVDPSQAEERRRMSELARKNISDVAARKYFSSAGYGKDREMRILMSYDSSPDGREANAKLFNTIMNGSPEERGQLIEKRIKDAMDLFNYVMNGNPTDAYLVEHFEQLFALQELATSAEMIRKDANKKDISRPFVLSQEAIDSLNLLERFSTDVEMKTQRVKMISNADYEHLNLPYLLTCDDHVFKKLENFIGSDVNDEMGENTALKGSLTQLDFHTTTDWSRKLLSGQRQKQLMYEIEKDFGDDKEKVTIKVTGRDGGILESPYTLSGTHEHQVVASNLTKGYVLVTSPTGDAICYRLNLDGSVKKASAAEMLSDMPSDTKVMLDMMEEANKGFFIGSKEYSTALKNMENAFATVQKLGNPPSPEKMDQAAAYYKTVLEEAEKYTKKKLSRPPTPKEQELIDQLDDYVFGPDDIIEAMSPREKLRFDTMKQATTFCKNQLAQLTLQREAAAAELNFEKKAADASKKAKVEHDNAMIPESKAGNAAIPKTHQELREWYQKFSKELYDKVQIDVTRKEDLGRVRVFKSDQWSVDNITPDMQITYAYMSHDGKKYADPEPPLGNFREYANWMAKNLNPEVSDAQIQKLYEQSCAGELMVYKPGGTLVNIQMVLTDADGNIKISVPASEYDKDNLKLPEDVYPKPPKIVDEPNPADFGCPQKPTPPKNMNPNRLSQLLDFFGIHTEYTDLRNYQKAMADYPNKLAAWKKSPDGLAKFNQAVAARATYVQQAEAYLANPYSKHYAAFLYNTNRFVSYADQEGELERQNKHMLDEMDYLKRRHEATPLGKLNAELSQIKNQLTHAHDTEVTLYNVIGHDPHPEEMPNHEAYKNYHPESYELPLPQIDDLTMEQEKILEENWKDLAAVAGFAAISDYDLLAPEPRPGFDHDQSAMLTYAMVFSNLFTENRSNVNHELGFVAPARKMAKEAIEAYSRNEPEQLGKLMGHGLRHNMMEAANLYQLGHRNTWGFLYLLNKTVETLDKHEGVWEATGLTQEEMDRARGYSELYKVLTRGHEARKELLEHATGVERLPQEKLEQAGRDALFASYVLCSVAASHSEQTDKLDTPEHREIAERVGKIPALMPLEKKADAFMQKAKAAQQRAEATKSKADIDKAEELQKQTEALQELAANVKQERDITNGKMTLYELKRESAPILKDLIKPDWVDAVKDQLSQHAKLPEAISSDKGIIDLFHSASELGMTTKTLALKPQAEQQEKALGINGPEIQNSELQAPRNNVATI